MSATSSGVRPHVRAFSLATGTALELASFPAYAPSFAGGIFVGADDVDGDGLADIVTGADASGGPHVRAFTLLPGGSVTEITGFFASDPGFRGGVRVATGR